MNPPRTLTRWQGQRSSLFQIVLVTLLIVVCVVGMASSAAQSQREDATSHKDEREFKSTVPEHVPIKVKLKNELSFKKMDNENWAREMEIEVKNTGSKPIYYLSMTIIMPEMVNDNGYPLAFGIHYGRKELLYLDTPLLPEDLPIRPGESTTLKVSENQVSAFEEMRPREKVSNPKKVEFWLGYVNFGDNTGLRGREGSPYLIPAGRHPKSVTHLKTELNDPLPPPRV